MKTNTSQAFSIIDIFFPKIDFDLRLGESKLDLKQRFRGDVIIKDAKTIAVRFGVGLFENQKKNGKNNSPPIRAIIESIGVVKYKSPIGNIKSITDIPMIANILASLYPFLREKMNYCFSNNKITMLLPPLNVINLLSEIGDSFKVVDARKKKSITKKKAKIS
ncbi:MAG: hypothetical protein ACUZ8O_06220 [Candidatus Anammoxibacter sp.]